MPDIATTVPTITSVDLVEIINDMREEGAAELRHDNFIAKIEKHPGIDAPKFLGTQKYGNNNTRKVYHLPKREAELMVMSESLAVQTKVYDRMTALEQQAAGLLCLRQWLFSFPRCAGAWFPPSFLAGRVGAPAKVRRFLYPVRQPDTRLPPTRPSTKEAP